MGEPARAAVLMALADGRALAATTLAAEAKVAPSTASGHLGRLVEGGLVTVESSGCHRYLRLASPEVAEALEALARLAPHQQVRSFSRAVVKITESGWVALAERLRVDADACR